jgi:multidrug efflux pump subunit AcrA (membrane-fusion protein)
MCWALPVISGVFMPNSFTRRTQLRLACGLFALTALAATSAPIANEFAVTPAQLQALGVQLQKLDKPAPINGLAFPARVVLPPSQEYVISAPVAGLVDQLLVAQNDSVKAGQPLLRLVSPEFGELQLKLSETASKARLSQKTAQRERLLFADGIIPERRVQEAESAAAEDMARQRQAESALRLGLMLPLSAAWQVVAHCKTHWCCTRAHRAW